MYTFSGKANQVYAKAIEALVGQDDDSLISSRVAATVEIHPAIMEITKPRQRLITAYGRPVNPAFALAEVLWILSGRNDVGYLKYYNSSIDNYSDDGSTFNAAYGERLRFAHGHDQIEDVVMNLKENPNTRQAVLNIWHPQHDRAYNLQREFDADMKPIKSSMQPNVTKDRACNVVSHLLIRNGRLDWVQFMRSNDIIWGTPNNFMQWMHLQEYIATRVGVKVGKYYHIADSLHLYDYHIEEARHIHEYDLYEATGSRHEQMGKLGVTQDAINYMVAASQSIQALNFEFLNWRAQYIKLKAEVLTRCGSYWEDVFDILVAWHAYKSGNDIEAGRMLNQHPDQVLAVAQMRHFYYWRWHQPGYEHIVAEAIDGKSYESWLKYSHHTGK